MRRAPSEDVCPVKAGRHRLLRISILVRPQPSRSQDRQDPPRPHRLGSSRGMIPCSGASTRGTMLSNILTMAASTIAFSISEEPSACWDWCCTLKDIEFECIFINSGWPTKGVHADGALVGVLGVLAVIIVHLRFRFLESTSRFVAPLQSLHLHDCGSAAGVECAHKYSVVILILPGGQGRL